MENKIIAAVVCIAKGEDNYIHEWIDYHLKLGFDDIIVYKNDWPYTIGKDKVTEVIANGENLQVKCYNNFLNICAKRGEENKLFDWVAFIDVDEYICLKKHTNIKDFLAEYNHLNYIPMNWKLFGDSNLTEPAKGVVTRFTKTSLEPDKHIKSLVKPLRGVQFLDVHQVNIPWTDTNGNRGAGPYNYNKVCDVIQLNHYFCKTLKEFEIKRNRGRADMLKSNQYYIRTIEDFYIHNFNEVEDLTACDFYKSQG
jgi:hypothetical protein